MKMVTAILLVSLTLILGAATFSHGQMASSGGQCPAICVDRGMPLADAAAINPSILLMVIPLVTVLAFGLLATRLPLAGYPARPRPGPDLNRLYSRFLF